MISVTSCEPLIKKGAMLHWDLIFKHNLLLYVSSIYLQSFSVWTWWFTYKVAHRISNPKWHTWDCYFSSMTSSSNWQSHPWVRKPNPNPQNPPAKIFPHGTRAMKRERESCGTQIGRYSRHRCNPASSFHFVLLRGVIRTTELRIKFCPSIWIDGPFSFTLFGSFRRYKVNSINRYHASNAAFIWGMQAGHYHLLQLILPFEWETVQTATITTRHFLELNPIGWAESVAPDGFFDI